MTPRDNSSVQRAVIHDTQYVPRWSMPVDTALTKFLREIPTPPSTVLVAEARTGFLAGRLSLRLPVDSRLVVIDPNPEMLDIARKRLEGAPQHTYYATQAIEHLNYADGVFFLATCNNHLLTRDDVTTHGKTLCRVVRPDTGHLLLSIPLKSSFRCFLDMMREASLRQELPKAYEAIVRFDDSLIDEQSLPQVLAEAGIEMIAQETVKLSFGFDSAEAFLFSPFVEHLFLPHWLRILPEDTQREPIFFDSVKSLNTYFTGIPFTTKAEVACILARPLQG